MTAPPLSVLAGQAVRTAVLVTGRRSGALAGPVGTGQCVVLRGRGRRTGASEALVKELIEAGVTTVVVPALAALHPSPARALGLVAALHSVGVVVSSLAEPGISLADPSTLNTVATFLLAAERRSASKKGSAVVAAVRQVGDRVGRPAKTLPVPPEEAQRLVAELGWRRAAKRVGISAASIRRALTKAGLLVPSSVRRVG